MHGNARRSFEPPDDAHALKNFASSGDARQQFQHPHEPHPDAIPHRTPNARVFSCERIIRFQAHRMPKPKASQRRTQHHTTGIRNVKLKVRPSFSRRRQDLARLRNAFIRGAVASARHAAGLRSAAPAEHEQSTFACTAARRSPVPGQRGMRSNVNGSGASHVVRMGSRPPFRRVPACRPAFPRPEEANDARRFPKLTQAGSRSVLFDHSGACSASRTEAACVTDIAAGDLDNANFGDSRSRHTSGSTHRPNFGRFPDHARMLYLPHPNAFGHGSQGCPQRRL